MKRKLVIITISYIIGLLWGLYFNKNITLFFISAFVVYAIIFRKNKFNILLILIIIISCIYNSKIKYNYENKYAGIYELEVVGNIIQVDENNEYYNKYVIEVEHVNKNDKFKKDRLLVYIKKGVNSNNIHYGDKIKVKGIFQNGSVSKNYKGYNYKEYLKTKKIYGIV